MKELYNEAYETESKKVPVEVAFSSESATLILNIDSQIPNLGIKRKEAEQLGLLEKNEFHLTVIGYDTGDEILSAISDLSEKEKEEKINEISKLSESIEWEAVLKNDFYYICKDYNYPDEDDPEVEISEKRESIVQIAEINGMDEFYQKLNLLLDKQFKVPLSHITLYTNSDREDRKLTGIGIYSEEQFEELDPKKI